MTIEETTIKFDPSKRKKKRTTTKRENPKILIISKNGDVTQASPQEQKVPDLYTYEQLVGRLFTKLQADKPDLDRRFKSVYTIPIVVRKPKKTLWVNFTDSATAMRRPASHFLEYTLIELGTTGNYDADSRLSIRGRFNPTQLETVAKNYIAEYVKCNVCSSNHTEFKKGNRITFIQCCTCGASHSVVPLRGGFLAVTSRKH